jgi:hypothetical protein
MQGPIILADLIRSNHVISIVNVVLAVACMKILAGGQF